MLSVIPHRAVSQKHPVNPQLIPNDYTLGQTTITGTYTGEIVRARAYVNGVGQAFGGTFVDGDSSYWIGSGVRNSDDDLQIEGLDSNNNVIVEKTKINIVGN